MRFMGRELKWFVPDIVTEVIDRLSAGESLRAICSYLPDRETLREPNTFPTEHAVRWWVIEDIEGFASQYTRARDVGLDCMADLALEVSARPQPGTITKDSPLNGIEVTTRDSVDRAKLHADTLKWYLSKLAPKRYGDRLKLEHEGQVDVFERLRDARKRVKKT